MEKFLKEVFAAISAEGLREVAPRNLSPQCFFLSPGVPALFLPTAVKELLESWCSGLSASLWLICFPPASLLLCHVIV